MGTEFSCPCSRKQDVEDNDYQKEKCDIIQEVMKGKLQADEILLEYTPTQDTFPMKICLIHSSHLGAFFANRNLLVIDKKVINSYFNQIFISNYPNQDSLVLILLQYQPSTELGQKRNSVANDYSAMYLVETINLVSNQKEKIQEQILNDLNSKLKKDYIFYGIINDPLMTFEDQINLSYMTAPGNHKQLHMSNSSQIASGMTGFKNFRILYKKSKQARQMDIEYSIITYQGELTSDTIEKIIIQNMNKSLKGIMNDSLIDESKKFSYFIFEENNTIMSDYKEIETEIMVPKISLGKNSREMFLKEITEKLNIHRLNLKCIINADDGVFLVITYSLTDIGEPE